MKASRADRIPRKCSSRITRVVEPEPGAPAFPASRVLDHK
jgi:hypothetical protein